MTRETLGSWLHGRGYRHIAALTCHNCNKKRRISRRFILCDFFQREINERRSMWHAGTRTAKDIRDTFHQWISSPWHETATFTFPARKESRTIHGLKRTRSEFFISINTEVPRRNRLCNLLHSRTFLTSRQCFWYSIDQTEDTACATKYVID